jgi:transcriptional regulator with XRE-family HTH domain
MRRIKPVPKARIESFGGFFANQRRTRTKMSLRQFCEKHGFDAGNLSKLERGRMAVPQSRDVLERYAKALGLKEGSDDWYEFFDRAAAENGRIPSDLLEDAALAPKLPVLFRALRDDDASDEKKLKELMEIIRRA